MTPIIEVYPDAKAKPEGGYFDSPSDYGPMLASLGYEILLQVDDSDYSGDSRLLLKDGQRRGLLIFGWGSCSGCDALQACESVTEIEDLRDQLHSQIKWFDNGADLLKYMNEKDWEAEWCWHTEHVDEMKQFVADAKAMLSK